MQTYSVAVESEGFSADWVDNLIVLSDSAEDAKFRAERFVIELRSNVIKWSEAYAFTEGDARVIGRIINTDEE